jgi:hypothetical protein
MSKQDHSESFVIEVYVAPEGACDFFFWFLTSVNSIYGSQDNYGQLMGPNFGSFGLPLFVEKTNDQVTHFFVIVDIIFMV